MGEGSGMTVLVGTRGDMGTGSACFPCSSPMWMGSIRVPRPLSLLRSPIGSIVESVYPRFVTAGEARTRSTRLLLDGAAVPTVAHDPSSALPGEESLEAVRQVDAR